MSGTSLVPDRSTDLARRRPTISTPSSRSPSVHACATRTRAALLIVGKGALNRGLALRRLRLSPCPACRDFQQIGPRGRGPPRLFDRAPGKHLQSESGVAARRRMGLMQVHAGDRPSASAKKYGATYDAEAAAVRRRPTTPRWAPAMLGDLVANYRGSYILTSVGYNAGPGRVREWVAEIRRSARSQGRCDRLGRAHSRSPRPATTCSASSKTCRSIARGSAAITG